MLLQSMINEMMNGCFFDAPYAPLTLSYFKYFATKSGFTLITFIACFIITYSLLG